MTSCQFWDCPWALSHSACTLIVPWTGHILGLGRGYNSISYPQQTFATTSLPLMGSYGLGGSGFLLSCLAGTGMAAVSLASHVALPLGGYAYLFAQLMVVPVQVPCQRWYCPLASPSPFPLLVISMASLGLSTSYHWCSFSQPWKIHFYFLCYFSL